MFSRGHVKKNPSINIHKNFLYIREYNTYKIILSQVLKKQNKDS